MGQQLTLDLEIYYEDGSVDTVRADQRDMATFERDHGIGTQEAFKTMTMIFMRELAWYALVRTGKLERTSVRNTWLEKVIEVGEVNDDEDDAPNPTDAAA